MVFAADWSDGATSGWTAASLVAAFVSVVGVAVFAVLLARARREERRFMVLPPLWPSAVGGAPGKESGPGDTASHMFQFAPVLEEEDRVQREILLRRARGFARALTVSLVLTTASVAWVVQSRVTRQDGMPPFVLLDTLRTAEQPLPLPAPLPPPAPPAAPDESLSGGQPPLARLDSVRALPPPRRPSTDSRRQVTAPLDLAPGVRSEEHTSELQSRFGTSY